MKLYNSMTGVVEPFVPLVEGKASIYTCGPTVYFYAHIGNLRTYVSEDLLVRALDYLGYEVTRSMNITDVGHMVGDADEGEDKMLQGAKREKKTVWDIAEYYTKVFFEDMEELNLKRPEFISKATDHIGDYIHFIEVLEEKGHTYRAGGNVYFDVSTFPDYNKLSKMPLENLMHAHRGDVSLDQNKKSPLDFVLWFTKSKFEDQEMKWDSPYGRGYPGWHLECSVISLKTLGEQMDIHCGGVDHIPTHHTNEIAQTESYTGKPWVKYWWHAEFLIDKAGKMSKSRGDFLDLRYLKEQGYSPMHYKYFLMGSHYRRQLVFTMEGLHNAKEAYQKLKKRTLALESPIETEAYLDEFKETIGNDLDTANVLTLIYEVLKDQSLSSGEKCYIIQEIDSVLQLDLFKEEQVEVDVDVILSLIEKRTQAKEDKNYSLADQIRQELQDMGITLMDGKEGTTWKKS